MNDRRHLFVVALGACALGLPIAGGAKESVERPFKLWGHTTVVIDLLDGSFEATVVGHNTHGGRSVSKGVGQADPVTLTPIWGHGVATSANGDEIHWEIGAGGLTQFTGGTGRFDGATGSFVDVPSDMEVVVDPVAMTLTLTYTSNSEGTIAY